MASRSPAGEFLLEVRCEEIPARMLQAGMRELGTRLFEELMARGLGPRSVETGFTPRRLLVAMKGLPPKEPDRSEELLGPPASVAFDGAGQPTQAAIGFARRCGIEPGELRRTRTEKGEYASAVRHRPGRPARQVLSELAPRLLAEIGWAKTMRWGAGNGPWVRPVHGLLALLDGEVVPCALFGVEAGDESRGHPVLSPRPFRVRGAADLLRKLGRRGIEPRFAERRRRLAEETVRRAAARGGTLVEDAELLDRLAAVCEVPGIVEGEFEPAFLALPREVLVTTLRDHQSAFAVERDRSDAGDGEGIPGARSSSPERELLPVFLTVMDRPDDPQGRVRAGNEWVVAARLADARFFWQEDLKTALADRCRRLEHLTFHARLGSYAEKSARLARFTDELCRRLGWDEESSAARQAAELLKADLTTEMVKEFTALQGVMGGVYAREEGYPPEVWQAIYDQYRPAGAGDPLPRGRAGLVVALADRLDTLVGFFGVGLKPSGSKDPFGLRRAAQGVVRILLERDLELDLDQAAEFAAVLYGDRLSLRPGEIRTALQPFLADRVRYLLGLAGRAYDEIEAGLGGGAASLPDLAARVAALAAVREERDFLSVVLAAKRIQNILRSAPPPAGGEARLVEPARLTEPAEVALHAAAGELRGAIEGAAARRDYQTALRRIAAFAAVLDRFFVEVMVMDKDATLRDNRLALLAEIDRILSRVARLTEMVVDRAELRTKAEAREPAAQGKEDER